MTQPIETMNPREELYADCYEGIEELEEYEERLRFSLGLDPSWETKRRIINQLKAVRETKSKLQDIMRQCQ